jgi:hypothetical protein
MSEPRNEPNPSGSDPATGPADRRPGPAAGANRFWEQYGGARRAGARSGNGGAGRESRDGGGGEETPSEHQCLEWCPICRGADVVRASTPPELRDQLESIQRDGLAMIKALIDAYVAKQAESAPPASRDVEDVPID